MTDSLQQRLDAAAPLLAELWPATAACLVRAGLDPLALAGTPPTRSELREDPYDHSRALYAEWRSAGGALLGSLLVHADGQAFAEFDVLRPHPRKPLWMVEAVTAWGRLGALKSELRLLPALGS